MSEKGKERRNLQLKQMLEKDYKETTFSSVKNKSTYCILLRTQYDVLLLRLFLQLQC